MVDDIVLAELAIRAFKRLDAVASRTLTLFEILIVVIKVDTLLSIRQLTIFKGHFSADILYDLAFDALL